MTTPAYKRILLKLSGEALTGNSGFGIDPLVLDRIGKEIGEIFRKGVQIAIVIGGGNLFRGAALQVAGIGRITGDQMGMLATIMNSLAMRDAFERANVRTRLMSAIAMNGVVDQFNRRKAMNHLQAGRVLVFSGGTGNPLVTTDSAASLRAIEIEADILLKATSVDGIYSADPKKVPTAERYTRLTYNEALDKELGIMDLSAFCQCRDHDLPIRVFNIHKPHALLRIILGEDEGTLVSK